jgi:branched-chain amino acid transport system permease protein
LFKEVIRSKWVGPSIIIFLVLLSLPSFIPRFYTYILALIFVTSLLAMSLNLVVGHGGMFQFHHGVFYGVVAYTVSLMLKKTSLPMWTGFVGLSLQPSSVSSLAGFVSG